MLSGVDTIRSIVVLVVAMAALSGCGGTGPAGPTTSAIAPVSGNAQSGTVGQALSQPLAVRVTDQAGAGVSGVQVSWAVTTGAGSLAASSTISDAQGQASVMWTLGTTAGTNTVTATASGLTGSPVTFTATGIAGPASALVFSGQPATTPTGAPIIPAVQVTAQDAHGNRATSFTGSVTVAIGSNPSGGALAGTITVAAAAGVATFSNLDVDKAGTGYTLTAGANGVTGATSASFNITAVATMLVFTVQPSSAVPDAPITPAVKVTAQDAGGNAVTSFTGSVTVAIGTNPSGGTLSGTTSVAAVNGVATFPTLSIDRPGTGFTVSATSGALAGATSAPFDILLTFAAVSAGSSHTCGVTPDGTTYCWGDNTFGELGDGTTTNRTTAVRVLGGLTFASVSAGNLSTCGVTTGGAAYCWGWNGAGQLGDGTTTNRAVPVTVLGGLTFTTLTAGLNHSCGVTTAGAAYCWGQNSHGQLGDGTTTGRNSPVAVVGALVFAAVSAGGYHTCGLTTAHAAYCWGQNTGGQLGDGTTTDGTSPVPVLGGLSFAAVGAGGGHTCGMTTGGAAYCWGGNSSGQLGDGTTTNRSAPVAVMGGLRFAVVSAGGAHTCGVTTGAAAYCWGRNSSGQLGDGTTNDALVPVRVL